MVILQDTQMVILQGTQSIELIDSKLTWFFNALHLNPTWSIEI